MDWAGQPWPATNLIQSDNSHLSSAQSKLFDIVLNIFNVFHFNILTKVHFLGSFSCMANQRIFVPVIWNIKLFQCLDRRWFILKWSEVMWMNLWKVALAALLCSKVSPFSWIRPAGLWCACFMPPPDIVGHFRTLWGHCQRDNVVTDTLWERQYSQDWQVFWRLGHMCLSTVILQFHWLVPHLWGRECSKHTLKAPSKKSFFQQFFDWLNQLPKRNFPYHLWELKFWQPIRSQPVTNSIQSELST